MPPQLFETKSVVIPRVNLVLVSNHGKYVLAGEVAEKG